MAELLNHSHCKVCQRAVRYGQDVCGDECRGQYAALQKRRSRTMLMFYAAGAFLILILIMQLMGSFGG